MTQFYWIKLRSVLGQDFGGNFSEEMCVQIADYILLDCFKEFEIKHVDIVRWWFRQSVIQLNNSVFQKTNAFSLDQISQLNDEIVKCGRLIISLFCEDTKRLVPVRLYAETILHQISNFDEFTKQAIKSIDSITDSEFESLLTKKLFILLQAAAVAMCYIRNDLVIQACQYQTVSEFAANCKVRIRDESYLLENCIDQEIHNLFYTANMMRIAALFIPAQYGKTRYMALATQLVEGRLYKTGSGHAVSTQRREKLFEIITNVSPVKRHNPNTSAMIISPTNASNANSGNESSPNNSIKENNDIQMHRQLAAMSELSVNSMTDMDDYPENSIKRQRVECVA